jgi:hypothetical protein
MDNTEWKMLLAQKVRRCISCVQHGGVIKTKFAGGNTTDKSFEEFFKNALTSNYPITSTIEQTEVSEHDVTVPFFWTREKVLHPDFITMEDVLSQLHHWKCCIIFDRLTSGYHRELKQQDLTDALIGRISSQRLYGDAVWASKKKKSWEGQFNTWLALTSEMEIKGWHDNPFDLKILAKSKYIELMAMYTETRLLSTMQHNHDIGLMPGTKENVGDTRPAISLLKIENDEIVHALRGLFFDSRGHLRRDLKESIAWDQRLGFIKFANVVTKDIRFLIPLKFVSQDDAGEC